ncbi:MAG: Cyclic di-GMP phosphodiesterase response regulator RpfG [Nitrospira sp.]|nr:Cyclic di-GMP phosphodiesterase response regulator RpfG [Nitrospira sp.]
MTNVSKNLPFRARIYVAVVVMAGCAAVTQSAASIVQHPPTADWLILAALTLLTGSFTIKVPSISARISVSETFVLAAVMSFGPAAATMIVALDTLIITVWMRESNRSVTRTLFNMSAGASAIWIAAHLFEALAPAQASGEVRLGPLFLPVLTLALSYFLINSSLIAIALGFERRTSSLDLWRQNFTWLGLNYLGGASVAVLLVNSTRTIDLTALGVIVPLLVITYLTFRTSWDRLEDANRHIAQVSDLYLSTIETLAMAVDAKDQITHGHIRRVQIYAVELAKRLGVSDPQQLKAIEAAALLHDMGKLAIPEHIMNKPGTLTAPEFEKMKRHSEIGADLLSSIPFPYPVVPIVRHHHEHWGGGGYPSGISGADIPLGARILSVVDCFDALTSDRPYRPRLTPADSFAILRERRGSMYDPLVVDTFIAAYPEIAPSAIKAGLEARTIIDDSFLAHQPESPSVLSLKQIRSNASETSLLLECRDRTVKTKSSKEAFDVAGMYLRQITPATVCAFYRHHPESDSLVCEFTVGDSHHLLDGLTIRVGERVTGWCAATRRTSVNADASLDLARIAEGFHPLLRSVMSTPIATGQRLAGMLTGYASPQEAFKDEHRYAFEQVASYLLERMSISDKPDASPQLVQDAVVESPLFPEWIRASNPTVNRRRRKP